MENVLTSNQHTREVYSFSATIGSNADIDEVFSETFTQSSRSFQKLVLEAVDETFSALGKKPKQAIYLYLEKVFQMSKQDIPYKIKKFARAIEKILGPGAQLVEIQIMKNLYQKTEHKLKYHPKHKNLTFAEYLTAMRAFSNAMNKIEKLA
jgi:hypothetical protein